jgi:sugar transferase (PEP-CTERM/EpsH1 system associated)
MSRPIHVVHVVFRLDTGGMENGIVNLINHLPAARFRHSVIALTEVTAFSERIRAADVGLHSLHKRPGKDPGCYLRMFRLLRRIRPDVVHTRNLGTLDMQPVAWLAGVPVRIHGEHGWDIHDPDGTSPKFRRRRRLLAPLIHRFMAVSQNLESWLLEKVGIPTAKVARICNGVDLSRFGAASSVRGAGGGVVVVGSVTRFEPIKDPLNLARAFVLARHHLARHKPDIDLRLLMVGDGPLRAEVENYLKSAGVEASVQLPGASADVPYWLARMDIFALGSKREGISNTVLEAMAAGLPVIASATGGNLELVVPSQTGALVPPENPQALADALVTYAVDPALRRASGTAAAQRAQTEYSLEVMVERYAAFYQDVCANRGLAA